MMRGIVVWNLLSEIQIFSYLCRHTRITIALFEHDGPLSIRHSSTFERLNNSNEEKMKTKIQSYRFLIVHVVVIFLIIAKLRQFIALTNSVLTPFNLSKTTTTTIAVTTTKLTVSELVCPSSEPPVKSVVFLKKHKTGSESVSDIIRKHAIVHMRGQRTN